MTTPTTPLAEQQQILREAIAKIEQAGVDGQPGTLLGRTLLASFRYALADHDDPDARCPAEPDTECIAVKHARKVIAGELP